MYREDGRILRVIREAAAGDYEHLRAAGLLQRWIDRRWVVPTWEIDPSVAAHLGPDVRYVVEHERVPFISYPYEWTFQGLRSAALLHLDLQLDAFAHGVQLSDASAYNVQFDGARPMFIDLLSFRRYSPGDYWVAQRQFCEQFLNPLLLRALLGVPHNSWYRGSLEGIPAGDLHALLPGWRTLSWNVFAHVTLPARLAATYASANRAPAGPQRPLSPTAYRGLLMQLRSWIARLTAKGQSTTTWSGYETTHTYTDDERARKRAAVARFVARQKPRLLWDMGCNAGEYSQLALESGAAAVVGFEPDHGACERAFSRAASLDRPFLPLIVDVANPSPDHGWNQEERTGLAGRGPADALLALAVSHHLAIGRNVPLEAVVEWFVARAPSGIIEFVQKADPTVRVMLASRADIFDRYSEEHFAAALTRVARVVHTDTVSATGRRLFVYER